MIKEGIYLNLSSDEYHNDKNSISRSALIDFKRNPRVYWAKHLNPDRPEREVKPSWEFGTAFHTLILEPHLFDRHYAVNNLTLPVVDEQPFLKDLKAQYGDTIGRNMFEEGKLINARQKEEKAKAQLDFELQCQGKIMLTEKDHNTLLAMRDSINANPRAKELVEGAVYESSYFWQDEHSQIMLKSRPDIKHHNMIVDLKTVSDASERTMQREVFAYGYDIQMAMIRDGVYQLTGNKIENFILLCVEKQYPYSIGICMLDVEVIERAHCEYKNLLLQMKECRRAETWEDYPITTITLPSWYT